MSRNIIVSCAVSAVVAVVTAKPGDTRTGTKIRRQCKGRDSRGVRRCGSAG